MINRLRVVLILFICSRVKGAKPTNVPKAVEWTNYNTNSYPGIHTTFASVINDKESIRYYIGTRYDRASEHFIPVMDVPNSKVKVWQLCSSEDIQVMEMDAIVWNSANYKRNAQSQGYNNPCHLIEDNSLDQLPCDSVYLLFHHPTSNNDRISGKLKYAVLRGSQEATFFVKY
jgi:hypothetical protein